MSGFIKGKIIAADKKQPLVGVHLVDLTYERQGKINIATTDIDGNYVLYAAPDDEIRISYVGYHTLVFKAKNIPKELYLQPETELLDEVVVTPKPKPNLPKINTGTKTETSQNERIKSAKKIAGYSLAALGLLLLFVRKKPTKKVSV